MRVGGVMAIVVVASLAAQPLCAQPMPDCNGNGVPDATDIANGTSDDCNGNGIPDECDLQTSCALQELIDCNFDGTLNDCDPDCNGSLLSDICELVSGTVVDCTGTGGLPGNAFFGQLLHQGTCQQCHGPGGVGGTAPEHRNNSRYLYQWKTSGCVPHGGGEFEGLTLADYANLEAFLSDLGGSGNGVPDACEDVADCDGDGVADVCAIAAEMAADCNANSVPDDCDIAASTSDDCNGSSVPDECEGLPDCNGNKTPDECEGLPDCNADGTPDECDSDCNLNGVSDVCDVIGGAQDCDGNSVPDECEPDCNNDGVVDACNISEGRSEDANVNGVPDECEADCNGNAVPDDLDLAPGNVGHDVSIGHGAAGLTIPDCNGGVNAWLEETVIVNFGGQCGLVEALGVDLQITHSWVGDLVVELESPSGTVVTLFSRVGLSESNPFCAGGECCGNASQDVDVELSDSFVNDVESAALLEGPFHPNAGATGHPGTLVTFIGEPECGAWTLRVHDASHFDDGTLDAWALHFRRFPVSVDCNANMVPDECDLASKATSDCDANGVPDDCEDCNNNGLADACDLAANTSDDCDANGVPDECDIAPGGTATDCNSNQTPDECDIAGGTAVDCNANLLPDSCESVRDCNSNGVNDECDIAAGIAIDCNANGAPDSCDLAGTSGLFVSSIGSGSVSEFDPVSGTSLGMFIPAFGGVLDAPSALAFAPNRQLLLADPSLNGVRAYDGDTGEFLGVFIPTGSQGLVTPVDLVFAPNGELFVANLPSGQVLRFEGATGAPLGVFATIAAPAVVRDMTFGPNGNLFVCTSGPGAAGVRQFNAATGAALGVFTSGVAMNTPIAIDFGPNGNLYVLDAGPRNIRQFNGTTGVFINVFAANVAPVGQPFSGRIEFGPDGHLYFARSSPAAVNKYNGANGALLANLVVGGQPPSPFGVAFRPPSLDCDVDGVPDECQDCNDNGIGDACDLAAGTSMDVDNNDTPDECQGADVELEIVIRRANSGADTATSLPPADASVEQGDHFFVELWATDRGPLNTGLEAVYVNVTFPAGVVSAVSVDHRPPFTTLAGGTIDNAAGLISNLGGRDAGASGAGIEPNWVRVAVVEMDALVCPAPASLSLSAAGLGVSAVNRGVLPPGTLSFGSASAELTFACVYDLSGDGFVNAVDLGVFAGSWLTGVGQPGFNADCDFDCSGFVNAADLGWFAGAWLQGCADLTESDLPPCRRCNP